MRADERDDEHPDAWSAAEAAALRAAVRGSHEEAHTAPDVAQPADLPAADVRHWHWSQIAPGNAVDMDLTAPEWAHIAAPRNETGERCPWPWEPQQLVGVPMGQYHCNYCGAMVVAGVPHPDYGDTT